MMDTQVDQHTPTAADHIEAIKALGQAAQDFTTSGEEFVDGLTAFNALYTGVQDRVCAGCDFFCPFGKLHLDSTGVCERHPYTCRVKGKDTCHFGNLHVPVYKNRYPINKGR